jgi:propionyl-CoA carboxylase alpha chain
VQVFGDTFGNVVHLFERECSIQRRHQKIVEESPSIGITDAVRTQLLESAVRLAEHIGYVGAGTVEFMVRGDDVAFLEMNTRLQVEHPVTEATVGVDLVAWQIAVARGERLPMRQEEIVQHGHAIEVRLYAEDPARDDLPATGQIELIDTDPNIIGIPALRIDSGFESGDVVSPFYDPMLAKVIASGHSREEAAARLALGLRRMRIHGPVTNRDLLVAILDSAPFVAGETTTAFLDHHPHLRHPDVAEAVVRRHVIAAALAPALTSESIPGVPSGWRNVPAVPETRIFIERGAETPTQVHYLRGRDGWRVGVGAETDVAGLAPVSVELRSTVDGTLLDLDIDGVRSHLRVSAYGDEIFVDDGLYATAWTSVSRFPDHAEGVGGHDPQAPVPGTVTGIHVQPGDRVDAGQLLVTLEAMKMEHRLTASTAGVVQAVLVGVGDSVDAHQILVRVEEES